MAIQILFKPFCLNNSIFLAVHRNEKYTLYQVDINYIYAYNRELI